MKKRMSQEEETELFRLFREEGDVEARDKIVDAHYRLAAYVARYYGRGMTDTEDLVQEGVIGILHAMRKFDTSKGVRFSSYAMYWIKHYVIQHQVENGIRFKATRTRSYGFNQPKKSLSVPSNKDPYPDYEIPKDGCGNPMSVRIGHIGFSTDTFSSLCDSIEDESVQNEKDDIEFLQEKLKFYCFSQRELEIIREIMDRDGCGILVDLAERWGVTRERVRQIKERMLKRVRRYLEDAQAVS